MAAKDVVAVAVVAVAAAVEGCHHIVAGTSSLPPIGDGFEQILN